MTTEEGARGALQARNGALNRRGPVEAFSRPMLASGTARHTNEPTACGGEGALVFVASGWTVGRPCGHDGGASSSGSATHVLERQPGAGLGTRRYSFN